MTSSGRRRLPLRNTAASWAGSGTTSRPARDAGLRFLLSHHDPAQLSCWEDDDTFGYRAGGNGEGRLALLGLCSDHRVDMMLSGHVHHDLVTVMPWSDGQGDTAYADTTCLQSMCGTGTRYPGYSVVEVSGDCISSYNYKEPKWSYPLYAGVVPGEENDLDSLLDPALEVEFSNRGDWSSVQEEVGFTARNSLDKDLAGARVKLFMPSGNSSSYEVEGAARVVNIVPPGSPGWVIVHAYIDLPALSETAFRASPR